MKCCVCNFAKLKGIVFSIAAIAAMHAQTMNAQTVVFSNNFDSLTVGQTFTSTAISGMTGNDDGAATLVRVSNAFSNSGSNSLYENDLNSAGTPAFTVTLGATYSYASVSFAAKLNSTATIYFANSSGATNFALCHENYGANGNSWELRDSTNAVLTFATDASTGYNPSTWSTLTATFNEANNTFTLTSGASTIFSISTGTYDTVNWSVSKFIIGSGWYSGTGASIYNYYDDIVITSIPEPSTNLLLMLAGVALVSATLYLKRKSSQSMIA